MTLRPKHTYVHVTLLQLLPYYCDPIITIIIVILVIVIAKKCSMGHIIDFSFMGKSLGYEVKIMFHEDIL